MGSGTRALLEATWLDVVIEAREAKWGWCFFHHHT